MNARKAIGALMIAGLAVSMASRVSAQAWIPMPGEYYSEFRASHSSSDHFYDDVGEKRPFFRGAKFETRELLSYNEIGWRKGRSIVLGLPARSVTLQVDPLSFTRTETGLADLLLGVRFKLLDGKTGLALQADWHAPLGYQRETSPTLGLGQQDLGARLGFGTSFSSLNAFLEAGSGVSYRFETPSFRDSLRAPSHKAKSSELVEDNVTLGFWIGPSVLLAARYLDAYALGSDVKTNYHRAGPRLTYRVDDRLDVFAESIIQFAGRNVEQANRYSVGVAFKNTRLNRLQGYLGGKRPH